MAVTSLFYHEELTPATKMMLQTFINKAQTEVKDCMRAY